jgi:hypothetical protein
MAEMARPEWDSLDLLIVPSPVLAEDGRSFPDVDPATGLYVGGCVRLEAALQFSLRYRPPVIVVVGGLHPRHGNRMTSAMRKFILERNNRVTVQQVDSLPCTRHNAIALFNQLGTQLESKRVAVLTNEFHLPRFLAFWSQLSGEYCLKIADPLAIAAERFVHSDTQHQAAAIKARHAAEERGLADLRAGKYTDRCLAQLESFAEVSRKPAMYLTLDEQRVFQS